MGLVTLCLVLLAQDYTVCCRKEVIPRGRRTEARSSTMPHIPWATSR